MNSSRRKFITNSSLFALGAPLVLNSCSPKENPAKKTDYSKLDEILSKPVLKTELFFVPVIIQDIKLLEFEGNYICTVTSKDGAQGISVSNNMHMSSLYPVFINRIQPVFIGKDAVQLEKLIEEAYVYHSNYKLQSLAIWVPLATLEFALLDMLGKIAGKPIGELIGNIHNKKIAVYQANNNRGKSAEESVENIKRKQAETGAKAVKIKVGGRMSREEKPRGRTEKLIPLVRKALGDDMVIYADSNGSYNAEEAIRIGKIMQAYNYDFFEEPVPFDWYQETKQVTDALNVPVAGGEQEASMRNFRWLIQHNALDIVQPDIFYFGGMIRSMKVARMAEVTGKTCTPHISNSGLGYLYMMHFVSALPNAGPYHEFKGFNNKIPFECSTSPLKSEGGKIKVPTGPGLGITIDPDFIKKHQSIQKKHNY